MALPPFLDLAGEAEYQEYFINNLVRESIYTHHGIRVHFTVRDFDHAFYECTLRNGVKDQFSSERSRRMSWIAHTLTDPEANWYQGWDKKRNAYDVKRSVAVASGDFVVVLKFRLRRDGEMAAKFVTCYFADNSINKIRQSPEWSIHDCKAALEIVRGR